MRARMALKYAGIQVEHREIELRNKPLSMLNLSPKGTVPVLSIGDFVLDQSIDIMHWALQQTDPDGWRDVDGDIAQAWIERNDGRFKTLLDQYKYPNRFPELNQEVVLDEALEWMLLPMERSLQNSPYLVDHQICWVDIAIFPFIRQFSMVAPQRFEQLPLPRVKTWLTRHNESELFHAVMQKYPNWIE
jgi:glutathione S-transferase